MTEIRANLAIFVFSDRVAR